MEPPYICRFNLMICLILHWSVKPEAWCFSALLDIHLMAMSTGLDFRLVYHHLPYWNFPFSNQFLNPSIETLCDCMILWSCLFNWSTFCPWRFWSTIRRISAGLMQLILLVVYPVIFPFYSRSGLFKTPILTRPLDGESVSSRSSCEHHFMVKSLPWGSWKKSPNCTAKNKLMLHLSCKWPVCLQSHVPCHQGNCGLSLIFLAIDFFLYWASYPKAFSEGHVFFLSIISRIVKLRNSNR